MSVIQCNSAGAGLKRTTGIIPASSDQTIVFYARRTTSDETGTGKYRTLWVTYDGIGSYTDYVWLGSIQPQQGYYVLEPSDGVTFPDTAAVYLYPFVFHKVAYRRTGTLHEFFLNDVLVGSSTLDVSAGSFIETWLGYDANATHDVQGTQFFNYREWNAALTDAEIAAEFYANTAVRSANLWCDTPLDGSLNDISGNGRNWTAVGSTSFVDPSGTNIKNGWGFRASATATGTTSLTITKPTGTIDDDLMILTLSHKGAGYATVPAGWTLIQQQISGTIRGEAYWKRASSEGANYSITGLADTACGAILTYDGGLLRDNPVNVSSARANPSGTVGYDPITPTVDDALLLIIDATGSTGGISSGFLVATEPEYADSSLTANARIALTTTNGTDCQLKVGEAILVKPGGAYGLTALSGSVTNVGIALALTMQPVGDTFRNRGYTSFARYYDTNENVAITKGPLNGTWQTAFSGPNGAYTHEIFDVKLSPNKGQNAAILTNQMATNVEGGQDMLFKRYWIGPCAPFFYTGLTLTVNFAMSRFLETFGIPPGTGNSYPKIHVYVTQGATTTVRQTLIDNSISGTVISGTTMRGLGAQALPDFTVEDGDYLCIELGVNVPDFVPHAPPVYLPVEWLRTTFWTGTGQQSRFGAAYTDGSIGESVTTTKAGWIETSWPIARSTTVVPAPANDASADATEITTIPSVYTADISTSQWTRRGVWYKWTAPADMRVIATCLGSMFQAQVTAFTGTPGTLATVSAVAASTDGALITGSRAYVTLDAVSGTTYYFFVRAKTSTEIGNSATGTLRFELFPVLDPGADDLFYPCSGFIAVYRDGQLINLDGALSSVRLAGCAIDYSHNPMWDFSTGAPTLHTSHRLVLGVFSLDYVEVLDVRTLNAGQAEIDFSAPLLGTNMNSVEIDTDGVMYTGWFGDTFKLVSDGLASFENSVATRPAVQLNRLLATNMSQQPGAPFTPDTFEVDVDKGGTDYISLDVYQRQILYTSSGQYVPVGGTQVLGFDLLTESQATPFTTSLPAGTGPNAGPKGIKMLPDGGALICNGSVVQRLNYAGVLTQTYTPSIPHLAFTLADVDLVADGTKFWVMDADSATFWQFDLATGTELTHFQTYLGSGNSTSFVVYRGDVPPLPPIPPTTATLIVRKVTDPVGSAAGFPIQMTGLTPASITLAGGQQYIFPNLAAGTYGVQEAVPVDWTLSSVVVSNGSPPEAITVATDEVVTVTLTNTQIPPGGAAGCPQPLPNLATPHAACPAPGPDPV